MSAKKVGGGKLSRTETVTVRLDPGLRYFAELAARTQRRTLSSFIEWAIQESLKDPSIDLHVSYDSLWDVDEADRFVKLVVERKELLNFEEQVLWKLVFENDYFWSDLFDRNDILNEYDLHLGLRKERLRDHWDDLKAVASGEKNKDVLPKK